MTSKQIKRLVSSTLEAMQDETKRVKTRQSTTPINHLSKKPYNWYNQIFLMVANANNEYETNERLTAKQSQKLWYKFKKGIKWYPICFFSKIEKELENWDTKESWIFNIYKVANIDCFEWVEKEDKKDVENAQIEDKTSKKLEILENYIDKENIQLKQWEPAYSPKLDTIYIPKSKYFISKEEYLHALSHEAMHSTWNSKRLDRKLDTNFWGFAYSKEELVAEFWACLFTWNASKNNFAYVSSRAKDIKENNKEKELFQAIKKSTKAVEYIEKIQ